MQIETQTPQPTLTNLTIKAESRDMETCRATVEKELAAQVKLDGFRQGKVPPNLARAKIDPQLLQETFLNRFIPQIVAQVLESKDIQPVLTPQVSLSKFVPFSQLELRVEIEHLGKVEIADYRKMSEKLPPAKVAAEEIEDIISKIRLDFATYKEVKRPAKRGDRVWIDLAGSDEKGRAVKTAQAANQSLILGQKTFVEDFEKQLLGQKTGQKLSFKLPAEKVNLSHLAGQLIDFKVDVNRVEAVSLPEIDQKLIEKVGPFKGLDQFKQFIEKQITQEKEKRAEMVFQGQLVAKLAQASTVEIPDKLIEAEIEKLKAEHQADLQRQQLILEDWLKSSKTSADDYEEKVRTSALNRLKGGLILRQIAQQEKIEVTDKEIEAQLPPAPATESADADRENARQDIRAHLITQRTLEKLSQIVLKKPETS